MIVSIKKRNKSSKRAPAVIASVHHFNVATLCGRVVDPFFKMNYLTQLLVHSGVEISSLLSFLAVTVCVGAIVTFFVK